MKSQAFSRHKLHYTIATWACFGCAGWLLTHNVHLSNVGLVEVEGWDQQSATVACWSMAALESAISILLTQPQYWDDIYRALIDFGGEDSHDVPRWVRFVLVSIVLSLFLGIIGIVYYFDLFSTHWGLYPQAPWTVQSGLFAALFVFGTEALAFAGGQVQRLARVARSRALEEEVQLIPKVTYQEEMLREMTEVSREQAKSDRRRMWEAFYRQNPGVSPR